MTTQLISAAYDDTFSVDFTLDAWFNATRVAKHFDKRPNDWLSLEATKQYIESLLKFHLPEKTVNNKNQLVRTKTGKAENGGGTWFHPKLAVAFARWLNVDFAIWCDAQIERILHGSPNQHHDYPKLASIEQRKPLVDAVRRLVLVSAEKGKPLTFQHAHEIVNLRMGVKSVEDLTVEQIPGALQVVGELFERVVLEGEYIARGEPCAADVKYISNQQVLELRRLADNIVCGLPHSDSGAGWILNSVRVCFSVGEIESLPVEKFEIVKAFIESKRDMVRGYYDVLATLREDFYKTVLGNGAPFTAALKRDYLEKYGTQMPKGAVNWQSVVAELGV